MTCTKANTNWERSYALIKMCWSSSGCARGNWNWTRRAPFLWVLTVHRGAGKKPPHPHQHQYLPPMDFQSPAPPITVCFYKQQPHKSLGSLEGLNSAQKPENPPCDKPWPWAGTFPRCSEPIPPALWQIFSVASRTHCFSLFSHYFAFFFFFSI